MVLGAQFLRCCLQGRLFELQTVRGFTQKHLPRLKASTRLDCLDLQDDMSLKAGILRYWCPSWWLMKRSLKVRDTRVVEARQNAGIPFASYTLTVKYQTWQMHLCKSNLLFMLLIIYAIYGFSKR